MTGTFKHDGIVHRMLFEWVSFKDDGTSYLRSIDHAPWPTLTNQEVMVCGKVYTMYVRGHRLESYAEVQDMPSMSFMSDLVEECAT